jgi:ABC-type antimicrobial peptide transport system permease subunit
MNVFFFTAIGGLIGSLIGIGIAFGVVYLLEKWRSRKDAKQQNL